jgi:hypothetical protein
MGGGRVASDAGPSDPCVSDAFEALRREGANGSDRRQPVRGTAHVERNETRARARALAAHAVHAAWWPRPAIGGPIPARSAAASVGRPVFGARVRGHTPRHAFHRRRAQAHVLAKRARRDHAIEGRDELRHATVACHLLSQARESSRAINGTKTAAARLQHGAGLSHLGADVDWRTPRARRAARHHPAGPAACVPADPRNTADTRTAAIAGNAAAAARNTADTRTAAIAGNAAAAARNAAAAACSTAAATRNATAAVRTGASRCRSTSSVARRVARGLHVPAARERHRSGK